MRDLASLDDAQGGAEQELDAAESIFQRVRSKYAALKVKGMF